MGADALLHAAVINNARWCDAVCRSHGYPGEFTGRLWISARRAGFTVLGSLRVWARGSAVP
jgi:hypothetical protein